MNFFFENSKKKKRKFQMRIEKFHAVIPSEESRIYAFKGKTMHNPVK